jgi:hypothetical protein
MYRSAIARVARPALRSSIPSRAAFSTTARTMAEGDTGAPRSGGGVSGYAIAQSDHHELSS